MNWQALAAALHPAVGNRAVREAGWQELTGWSSSSSWQCSAELHSGPASLRITTSSVTAGIFPPFKISLSWHYREGRRAF